MTEVKDSPPYDADRFNELGRRRRLRRLGIDPDKPMLIRVSETPSVTLHMGDVERAKVCA